MREIIGSKKEEIRKEIKEKRRKLYRRNEARK
jgi:hypothetical protein